MIYRFNLQPWREAARQKQKKNFIAITALLALLALAFVGLNYYIEKSYIDDQERTKQYLQSQITQLQSAKKKVEDTKLLIAEINKQIVAIETLQSQRGIVLRILDYLATNTPENVFINHIGFDGVQFLIDGVAENDSGVADFMRVLQANGLLTSERLVGIESASSTNRYEVSPSDETKAFSVTVNLKAYEGDINETR